MRAVLVLAAFLAAAPAHADAPLNADVLALIATYPDQGFGGYAWPSPRGQDGTTRDLFLGRTRIARGGVGNHCVGVTFEVFWRALARRPGAVRAARLDPARVRRLRARWYVPVDGGRGAAEALERHGLGRSVPLDDAQPGDFVQMWMHGGLGHSVVFLGWVRGPGGTVVAIRYWSSQPWTGGLGVSESVIGDGDGEVDRARIYVARAIPRVARR
jgi:hypothetical protein